MNPSSMVGAFDQINATAKDMAITVAKYRQALLDNGVPKQAADELTLAWQEAWCEMAFRAPTPT